MEKSPFIKKSPKIKSYQFETLFSRTFFSCSSMYFRKKRPRNPKHGTLFLVIFFPRTRTLFPKFLFPGFFPETFFPGLSYIDSIFILVYRCVLQPTILLSKMYLQEVCKVFIASLYSDNVSKYTSIYSLL